MYPLLQVCQLTGNRVGTFTGKRSYVSTGDVNGNDVIPSASVTFDSRPSRADLVANVGDVLFARMQATDKVVLVTEGSKNYIWSTGFAALRPRQGTNSRWVAYWLQSRTFQERKNVLCTGATQKAITNDAIGKLSIPLPPLSEQERIVRILNEADKLRQLRAEADRRTAGLIPALFHEMFGEADKTWPIAKFSELGSIDRGKSKHRPRNEPSLFGGPYPFVQTGDIANCGGRVESYSQTYSELGLAQSKLWPEGTLCITIAANIAKCAVLTFPACFPDSVVGFIPNERITIEFARSWIETLEAKLEEEVPQAAQKNINLQILRNLELRVPPIELQRKFSSRVAEIHAMEAQQTANRQDLENLFKSLLHRAFQGDV